MQFTKALFFLSAIAPVAFAAEAAQAVAPAAQHKTLTLWPATYTPTPTPTSTPTPTWTPTPTHTPTSTPLVSSTPLSSVTVKVSPSAPAPAPPASTHTTAANGASSLKLSGAMVAGAMAVAGFVLA
ncbi:hypothetical protein N7510_010242 [Penicillium lagena]|uniref:uncharacterized protein n=1 Tax=Penicillium lagena TaxID=94218 RepID=UPI002541F52F|nr:uncharacterized protein N7510_010242 [Penicillium lagena]KAJ5605088.1 hypothetical protein N7510_010242 [Penicillium lagena]